MLKIIKINSLLFLLIIYSTSCSNDDVLSNTGNEDDVIGVSSSSLFKILNPTRGSLLNYGAIGETYPVEGEVCDSINDISNIFINDEAVSFDNNVCNIFNTEVNHSWGLNVIKGRSINDEGNEVLVVQSNISSNEYYNSEENNIGIPSSFRLRLDQEMIDKIENIMRSELNNIFDDVMEDFIPYSIFDNVVVTNYDCILYETNNLDGMRIINLGNTYYSFDMQSILLDETSQRIKIKTSINNLSTDFRVYGYEDLGCLGHLSDSVDGTLEIATINNETSIGYNFSNNELEFFVDSVDKDIGGISFYFSQVVPNIISDLILFLFDDSISPLIEEIMAIASNELMINLFTPQYLQTKFGENSYNIPSIELNDEYFDMNLIVESKQDYFRIKNDYIEHGISLKVLPEIIEKVEARSIIGTSSIPNFEGSFELGIGVKHDFINQFLWAIWAGGGFDGAIQSESSMINLMNQSEELNGRNIKVNSIETINPPILMPSTNETWVKIGVGDILIKLDMSLTDEQEWFLEQPVINANEELEIYVSVIYNAEVEFDSESNELLFNYMPQNETQINVQTVNGIRTLAIQELETLISEQITAVFENNIKDSVSQINIPSFPASLYCNPPCLWQLSNGVLNTNTIGYFVLKGEVGDY